MPRKLPFSKRTAVELTDQVVLPFLRWLVHNYGSIDEAHLEPLNHALIDFEEALFHDADMAPVVGHLTKALSQAGVTEINCSSVVQQLLTLMRQYVEGAALDVAMLNKIKVRLNQVEGDFCAIKTDGEDGFIAVDAPERDERIDDMHTSAPGREVISAAAFLAQAQLDEELYDRLHDELEELEISLSCQGGISAEQVGQVVDVLTRLSAALDATFEFADLALALNRLAEVVPHLSESTLDEQTARLGCELLTSIVDDLMDWLDHLFVTQDAQDIHYLDAALMAAIDQLAQMLEASRSGSDEQQETDVAEADDGFLMF